MDTILAIPGWSLWLVLFAGLKALAFVIVVFSLLGIVYVIIKSLELDQIETKPAEFVKFKQDKVLAEPTDLPVAEDFPFEVPTQTQKIARARWEQIMQSLAQSGNTDYKIAVIEADALVDYVLKAYGYPGETMGDRMRAITPTLLPSIDSLWTAHKIRNEISHNAVHTVDERDGKRALAIFEQVLKDLDAI